MNPHAFQPFVCSTASKGRAAVSSKLELVALGEHLGSCRPVHGHLFALHCGAQAMHGFFASRFVTTLVLVALFFGLHSWLA
jgi:hypothetical protein